MDKRSLIMKAAMDRVGCGYVMGATGWVCTQARLNAQAKQYPDYAAMIFTYGPKWIGKRCYDCAQLTRAAAAAGGYRLVSGATSQWNQDIWEEKGSMATLPEKSEGLMLFRHDDTSGKKKHVAVCLGDGTIVEARGHAYGVVRRNIGQTSFTHWAKLKGLDENMQTEPETDAGESLSPTLRKGDRGADVKTLQQLLLTKGMTLPQYGADGIFGGETQKAVIAFQKDWGLDADGVAGPKTWAALYETADPDDTPEEEPAYQVTIPGLSKGEAEALAARYPGAAVALS